MSSLECFNLFTASNHFETSDLSFFNYFFPYSFLDKGLCFLSKQTMLLLFCFVLFCATGPHIAQAGLKLDLERLNLLPLPQKH